MNDIFKLRCLRASALWLPLVALCPSAFAQWGKSWQAIEGFDLRVNVDNITKQQNREKGGTGIIVMLWVGLDFEEPLELRDFQPGTVKSMRSRVNIYCDDQTYSYDTTHLFSEPGLSGTQVGKERYLSGGSIAPDGPFDVLAKRYCNRWKIWQ